MRMINLVLLALLPVTLPACWPQSSPQPPAKNKPKVNVGGDGPISEAEGKEDRRTYMWSEDPRKNDSGPHYSDPGTLPEPAPAVKLAWAVDKAHRGYMEAKAKWGPNDPYTKELQQKYLGLKAEQDKSIDWINKPR